MLDELDEDINAGLCVTDALSLWAPWAWAICFAGKDIENRGHASIAGHARKFIGRRIAIHCSLWGKDPCDMVDEFESVREIYTRAGVTIDSLPPTTPGSLDALRGKIIGHVRVNAVVTAHGSPWFVGPFGIVVSDPVVLAKPVACRGAQGIWRMPHAIVREVAEAA